MAFLRRLAKAEEADNSRQASRQNSQRLSPARTGPTPVALPESPTYLPPSPDIPPPRPPPADATTTPQRPPEAPSSVAVPQGDAPTIPSPQRPPEAPSAQAQEPPSPLESMDVAPLEPQPPSPAPALPTESEPAPEHSPAPTTKDKKQAPQAAELASRRLIEQD
eukprot:5718781-Prymnesium_polylepis.1